MCIRDRRQCGEDLPEPSVAQVFAALAPIRPAAPHRLMHPSIFQSYALEARREAAMLAAHPPKEEGYRPPLVPPDHPRVLDRAARRRARRGDDEW